MDGGGGSVGAKILSKCYLLKYNLMEFLNKLKPEAGVHVADQMVGKFR